MTTTPSYLTQYDSQTQNGILNAGLNSVMGVVNSNGSVSNLVSQGFTPQAVGSYKDASGNTVQAPFFKLIQKQVQLRQSTIHHRT